MDNCPVGTVGKVSRRANVAYKLREDRSFTTLPVLLLLAPGAGAMCFLLAPLRLRLWALLWAHKAVVWKGSSEVYQLLDLLRKLFGDENKGTG